MTHLVRGWGEMRRSTGFHGRDRRLCPEEPEVTCVRRDRGDEPDQRFAMQSGPECSSGVRFVAPHDKIKDGVGPLGSRRVAGARRGEAAGSRAAARGIAGGEMGARSRYKCGVGAHPRDHAYGSR